MLSPMSAKSLILFEKTLQSLRGKFYYKTRLKNRLTVEPARDYILVRELDKCCVRAIGGRIFSLVKSVWEKE